MSQLTMVEPIQFMSMNSTLDAWHMFNQVQAMQHLQVPLSTLASSHRQGKS